MTDVLSTTLLGAALVPDVHTVLHALNICSHLKKWFSNSIECQTEVGNSLFWGVPLCNRFKGDRVFTLCVKVSSSNEKGTPDSPPYCYR